MTRPRILPWAVAALSLSAAAAGYVLLAANGAPELLEQIVLGSVFMGYALVGALIASIRPGNRIGWILIAIPTLTGVGFTAEQYAVYASTTPGAQIGSGVAAWLASWLWFPGLGMLGFGLLLYPNGRAASGRWRWVGWLLATSIVAISVLFAFAPTPEDDGPFENPMAILPADVVSALEGVSAMIFLAAILVSASAPLVRFRHARGVERQQIKWFLAAATFLAVVLPITFSAETTSLASISTIVLFPAALAALPVAIGVAILRYRLFDIDLLINRTLVYGALTITLGAVYVGAVLVLQALLNPITGGGTLAVATSTLAVAALFQPLRRRIQSFVDRRFFRSRYDLARTVEAFNRRLRSDLELASLTDELAAAAETTMQPASVSVWLREASR